MSILITSGGVVTLGGGVPRRGGSVIVAESASAAHVQAAVDAASPGDTVSVPAESVTWSSAVTVSKPISIIGTWNGTTGTTLTGSGALGSGFFHVTNVTSAALLRISGFHFVMSGRTQAYAIKIATGVDLSALRIDHNRFDAGVTQIYGYGAKGVIDHNAFYNGDKAMDLSAGSEALATASWVSMAAGTADALFIEDNTFIDDADFPGAYTSEKIGTENGGKFVVRYNTFTFDNIPLSDPCHPFGAHGSAKGGASGSGYWQEGLGARRGQSVIEFYYNTIHGKRVDFMYSSRGSANLVHHNDLVTTVYTTGSRIYFNEEEQYESSNWSPLRTAWPAEDQVHNTFIWANTYQGDPYFDDWDHIALGDASTADYIQLNRDVFLHEPAATGGKASFTGMNGGTNTYPTDGNTLPTLGAMTFSASGPNEYYGYVPYTHPHPLTV